MPRFLNARTTTLATSLSSPGRILGSPSRIVTLDPRSENAEANSQPMAPPPMTAMRAGMRSSIRTSSEVMIGPPTSKPGISRGAEPDGQDHMAGLQRGAGAVRPFHGDRALRPEGAGALVGGDLAAADQTGEALPHPFDDRLLASLADGEVDRRRTGVDAEVLGVGDMAVDGGRLQEGLGRDAARGAGTYRPPSPSRPAPPTDPADAPYSAAAYPPGPPPMITRSNSSAVGITSFGVVWMDRRSG